MVKIKPFKIPCVTSLMESAGFPLHLISVRKDKPFLKATELTLVDCFTFGLIRNKHRIDPYKHYEFYIDFVKEHHKEDDIVFIAPDWEWLTDTNKLNDSWMKHNEYAKVLVVPDSFLFDQSKNVVGHGLKPFQSKAHENWTHSFSAKHTAKLDGPTKLWTHDSLGFINEIEEQRSVSFQSSLGRLRLT